MTRTIQTRKGPAILRTIAPGIYRSTGARGEATYTREGRDWRVVHTDGTGRARGLTFPTLKDCAARAIMQGLA